jgi:hypothetical protein
MKKLILVFVAIAITAGVYAQADSTNRKMSPRDMNSTKNQNMQHNSMDKSHADGVMMKDGKLMKVKDGKTSMFEENEMTLSNGTRIMKDGTCIKKDGTKITLKDGQHMDMSGNLISNKPDKDNNMYLVPDSTRKKNY